MQFSGLYKVTLADLQGFGPGAIGCCKPYAPASLEKRQQVPAQFLGDNDGIFEPAEQLLFYANVSRTFTVILTWSG